MPESIDETSKKLFGLKEQKYAPIASRVVRREPKNEKPLALVTGATGRLGSYLIPELLKEGYAVRALVKDAGKVNLAGVEIVEGDVLDKDSLLSAAEDVKYVFHLAAILLQKATPEMIYDVNYRGTRNLAEACMKKAYGLKRFVFLSSIAVHGHEDFSGPANEEAPLSPAGAYGESKRLAEQAVESYKEKLPYTILRPGIIYGPGFDEGFATVLNMIMKGKMAIVGSGNNIMPLVHARDIVQAIILAAKKDAAIGRTYLIISPEQKTQRELLALAAKTFRVQPPRKSVPKWLALLQLRMASLLSPITGKKPSITQEYLELLAANRPFNVSRAKKELGWVPSVSIEEGMREYAEYFKGLKK